MYIYTDEHTFSVFVLFLLVMLMQTKNTRMEDDPDMFQLVRLMDRMFASAETDDQNALASAMMEQQTYQNPLIAQLARRMQEQAKSSDLRFVGPSVQATPPPEQLLSRDVMVMARSLYAVTAVSTMSRMRVRLPQDKRDRLFAVGQAFHVDQFHLMKMCNVLLSQQHQEASQCRIESVPEQAFSKTIMKKKSLEEIWSIQTTMLAQHRFAYNDILFRDFTDMMLKIQQLMVRDMIREAMQKWDDWTNFSDPTNPLPQYNLALWHPHLELENELPSWIEVQPPDERNFIPLLRVRPGPTPVITTEGNRRELHKNDIFGLQADLGKRISDLQIESLESEKQFENEISSGKKTWEVAIALKLWFSQFLEGRSDPSHFVFCRETTKDSLMYSTRVILELVNYTEFAGVKVRKVTSVKDLWRLEMPVLPPPEWLEENKAVLALHLLPVSIEVFARAYWKACWQYVVENYDADGVRVPFWVMPKKPTKTWLSVLNINIDEELGVPVVTNISLEDAKRNVHLLRSPLPAVTLPSYM
jgi:hypothetical protein